MPRHETGQLIEVFRFELSSGWIGSRLLAVLAPDAMARVAREVRHKYRQFYL